MRTPLLLCCAVLAALVSGCGFTPMYGKKAGGYNSNDKSKIYAGVTVDNIARREGQILHMELEDALNPNGKIPPHPEYRLAATISINEVAIGVARDATVSRFNIYFDSQYTLFRNSDNKAVTTGSIRHVGSYNNQANAYYSTYISRDDGIKRGLVEVAELYRMRLASYLSEGAPEQKNPPKMQPLPSYPNPSWNDGAASTLGAPPIPGAIAIPR